MDRSKADYYPASGLEEGSGVKITSIVFTSFRLDGTTAIAEFEIKSGVVVGKGEGYASRFDALVRWNLGDGSTAENVEAGVSIDAQGATGVVVFDVGEHAQAFLVGLFGQDE